MKKYILYGTDHSYYTGKVRPYLRYKGVPYQEKLATLWVYSRIIIPRTGVKYIPVLQTPENEIIQDTTEIIDYIEARHSYRSVYPDTPQQKLVALLFELYGDEWFTLPAMHFRWSFLKQQENYVMEEFGNVGGKHLPNPIKRLVGRKLSAPFKNALTPLGITPETIPDIENWYQQFISHFEAHLKVHSYLLGSRPCIGDFALAGPLYAHMWKDPVPRKYLQANAPAIIDWINRINAYPQPEGSFLLEDEVPDTLYPILAHLFKEHWPILEDTARRLPEWLAKNPDKSRISRVIGTHHLKVGSNQADRFVYPYSQWMMQRPLDFYQALSSSEKTAADKLLKKVGGYEAMQFEIPTRVIRARNQLIAA